MKKLNVIPNTTCFAEHENRKLNCLNSECKQWIDYSESYNCAILASKKGALKQEIVGNILGLTRMRVCQIEKTIINKICADVKSKKL